MVHPNAAMRFNNKQLWQIGRYSLTLDLRRICSVVKASAFALQKKGWLYDAEFHPQRHSGVAFRIALGRQRRSKSGSNAVPRAGGVAQLRLAVTRCDGQLSLNWTRLSARRVPEFPALRSAKGSRASRPNITRASRLCSIKLSEDRFG
jgi:hypothetical protein